MNRSSKNRRSAPRDRGFALLLVLWIVVLLSVIAAGFAGQSRLEADLQRNEVLRAEARHLADAGVEIAVKDITEALFGAAPVETFRDDGAVSVCALGDAMLAIAIQDEGGKVSLNAAPPDLLARLFEVGGAGEGRADALADAVVDFRDEDDMRAASGAERDDYVAAGRPGPKNAPFETVEELAGVLGVSADLYARVRGSVTPFSWSPEVDPVSATPLARQASVFDDDEMADAIGATAGDALAPIASLAALSVSDKSHFEISVVALTADGGRFVRRAVVEILPETGELFSTVSWRVGDAGEARPLIAAIAAAVRADGADPPGC